MFKNRAMKRFISLFLILIIFTSVFSACGTAEPEEQTTAVTTTATSETTTAASEAETTTELTSSETAPAPTSESQTAATTEITLSPEELAVQKKEELKFENVMANFTYVDFELQNEIPDGDNELADIVSGMRTDFGVDLEDELLEDIRLMINEPYLSLEDGTEWDADEPTAVVEIKSISGLETEKGVFRFYFKYIPNDSAEESELIPLCYTEVGFKTYVYRMTEESVVFFDDIFDGLYIRSADTWYEPTQTATDVTSEEFVGAELTEGEIKQQEIINDSVAMRIKVIHYMCSWEDDLSSHIGDFRCIYEMTDEETISEFCSVTDKANLIKFDKFLGFGRGGEWTLQVTFVSDRGEENTYYFTRARREGSYLGVWSHCITNVGEDWYMYGMNDETVRLLESFFDKIELKSMTTR